MKGWIELFGDSEISIRMASLGVLFTLTRAWFDRRTALELNEVVFAREYPLLEKNRYFALDVYSYGFRR